MGFPGNLTISALTHSFGTNMIFWAAGPRLWNTTLTANEGDGQPLGEIRSLCSIIAITQEWITGNFYLACEYSGVVVCGSRDETTKLHCSRLTAVHIQGVRWLALSPNTG